MYIFEEQELGMEPRVAMGAVCLGSYIVNRWQGTLRCLGAQMCATNSIPNGGVQRAGDVYSTYAILSKLLPAELWDGKTLTIDTTGKYNAPYLHNCWQIWRQQYERPWSWYAVRRGMVMYSAATCDQQTRARALFTYYCGGYGHSMYNLRFARQAVAFVYYYDLMPAEGVFSWRQFSSDSAYDLLRQQYTYGAKEQMRVNAAADALNEAGWPNRARVSVEQFLVILGLIPEKHKDMRDNAWD